MDRDGQEGMIDLLSHILDATSNDLLAMGDRYPDQSMKSLDIYSEVLLRSMISRVVDDSLDTFNVLSSLKDKPDLATWLLLGKLLHSPLPWWYKSPVSDTYPKERCSSVNHHAVECINIAIRGTSYEFKPQTCMSLDNNSDYTNDKDYVIERWISTSKHGNAKPINLEKEKGLSLLRYLPVIVLEWKLKQVIPDFDYYHHLSPKEQIAILLELQAAESIMTPLLAMFNNKELTLKEKVVQLRELKSTVAGLKNKTKLHDSFVDGPLISSAVYARVLDNAAWMQGYEEQWLEYHQECGGDVFNNLIDWSVSLIGDVS